MYNCPKCNKILESKNYYECKSCNISIYIGSIGFIVYLDSENDYVQYTESNIWIKTNGSFKWFAITNVRLDLVNPYSELYLIYKKFKENLEFI